MSRRPGRRRTPSPGYVYVLSNPAMPGIVKVGRTALDPARRARELRTTGVPGRFRVAYSAWTSDASGAEAVAHRLLAGARVSRDREFFRVAERRAASAVARACGRRRIPGSAWLVLGLLLLAAAWKWAPWAQGLSPFLRMLR